MIAGGAAAIVGGILSVALIPSREGPFGASAASVVSPTPPRKASPGSLHQQSTSLRVKLRLVLGNSVVLVLAWCTFAMYIVRSGLSDWSVTLARAIRAMRPRDHTPDDARAQVDDLSREAARVLGAECRGRDRHDGLGRRAWCLHRRCDGYCGHCHSRGTSCMADDIVTALAWMR